MLDQDQNVLIMTRVPNRIADILLRARKRAHRFAKMQASQGHGIIDDELAKKYLEDGFVAGLDIARRSQKWDALESFSKKDRRTIRIRTSPDTEQEILRLMNFFVLSKNTVITQAIWSATFDRLNSSFQR